MGHGARDGGQPGAAEKKEEAGKPHCVEVCKESWKFPGVMI